MKRLALRTLALAGLLIALVLGLLVIFSICAREVFRQLVLDLPHEPPP